MAITGCKWIDTDLNISPNSPTDVNMADLLPVVQSASGYAQGGDLSRFSTIPMQHLSGVNRQSFAFERYVINESDVNNLWSNSYVAVLKNAQIIIRKADELNAPHYAGIAKVMTAHTLGSISAVWGDIPYSEALKGDESNLTPSYDTQEAIYNTIQSLLNSAINDFAQPAGAVAPAGRDLIHGGNPGKWTRTAVSLKARYALHLSKRNGYGPVLQALNEGAMADNDDNFRFRFGNNVNERNPIYQFDEQRADIRVGAQLVNMMAANNDPRIPSYCKPDANGGFTGSVVGSGNEDASFVGPHYASTNSPVYFMTYAETKFIEAEAKLATDPSGAAVAYYEGVAASLEQHGISDQAWLDANFIEDAASITLEKIINAKYIALFTNSEVWVDWRRTGLPTLQVAPNPATQDNQLPRRFVYPLGERLYNGGNMPSGVNQSTRVWWDN